MFFLKWLWKRFLLIYQLILGLYRILITKQVIIERVNFLKIYTWGTIKYLLSMSGQNCLWLIFLENLLNYNTQLSNLSQALKFSTGFLSLLNKFNLKSHCYLEGIFFNSQIISSLNLLVFLKSQGLLKKFFVNHLFIKSHY